MSRKMTQVGVAWKKKTQDGKKEFLSVVITNPTGKDINLSIWSNSYKEKDGQPDFIIYKPTDERPAAQARTRDSQPSEFPSEDNPPDDDVEVPF